jgi:very-short-patch-repair endonuclease
MTLKKPIRISGKRGPGVIGAVKNKKLFEALYPVAIKMRKESTNAERILWQELRAKKLGVKFRRQHLIDQFIVDFYCVELGLVVEVDGGIHIKQISADREREQILRAHGCSLVRFANVAVEENLPKVVEKIKNVIRTLIPPRL